MGVPVTGTIQTTDPATDTYAVIDPAEGIDGWRSVADHAARNAITTLRRREGMAVYCRSDPLGTFYQLNPAPWDGTDADWTQIVAGGSGTVTSVSVATANGLAGTVATDTTTPAITLTTTVTGILKGDGTAISAATAGTDYLTANQSITLSGDVSGTGTTAITTAIGANKVLTAMIAAANVTYAKIQDVAAASLLGNPTGSAASPSEITLGTGLAFAGTTLRATGGTGTVTSINAGTGLTGGTITGAGTIALDVPVSGIHGGTGLASAVVGDILYASLANTWSALAGNTTATKKYLTGTGTGSAAQAPAWGTIAAADLPTTGLNIASHYGAITTDSISGAATTFNLGTSDWHTLTLDHTGTTTLSLTGGTTGQQFTIVLVQDSTGTCLVTWFSGIKWPGGTVPTLTTTASKTDVFTFKCISAGVYLGFIAGQNL